MHKFILKKIIQDIDKSENLEKGEKGDWKKEGYTLHHESWNDDRPNYHPKTHDFYIRAKDKHGKTAGYASITHEGKKLIPAEIRVNDKHQRKGLASAMYLHAQQLTGKRVSPSENQSPDAEKLWTNKNRKFGKSEDVNKSEQDTTLVHYSPTQGLTTIEPKYHGVRGIGAETKHTSPQHKMSFYYTEGTKPEDIVISGAKSKYTTQLGGKKIYDIATDPEGLISSAKEKANQKQINRGVFTHDDLHDAIKSGGYHGFKNSSLGGQMGNVIAMYHPMNVTESPIEFNKSEDDLMKAPIEDSQPSDFASEVLNTNRFSRLEHKLHRTYKLKDGMFYHIYHESHTPADKIHAISNSKNPADEPLSIIQTHLGSVDPEGNEIGHIASFTATHPQYQGQGLGTRLKKLATKFHGSLYSDQIISPAENASWKKLKKEPRLNTFIAPTQHDLKDEYDEDDAVKEASEQRHLAQYKPKKLAASEKDIIIKAEGDDGSAPLAPAPQQLTGPTATAPKHSDKVRAVAESYMKSKGKTLHHPAEKVKVDPAFGAKVAQAYEQMPHNPNHPEVKSAYNALIGETSDQFQHMLNSGLKVSKMKSGMPNPYMNSKDVSKDINENNHLWYYPTSEGFGSDDSAPADHPMLTPTQHLDSEGKPMLANDLFRVVHDYFGHAKEGNTFNHHGEENAWMDHRQMYSPLAARAMSAETRGQNSWVNFGPHGENNRANPAKTVYAQQKAGLLPTWAEQPNVPMKKSEKDLMKGSLQSKLPFNPMSKENKKIQENQTQWTGGGQEKRPEFPKMDENARVRALNKLHSQTEVRRHPETGERMFLMHRGMGKREYENNHSNGIAQYENGTQTSWSPKKSVADSFVPMSNLYPENNHRSVSAWIPESALLHSVNQFNSPTERAIEHKKEGFFQDKNAPVKRGGVESSEQEWIVEHRQPLHHAKNLFQDASNVDKRINTRQEVSESNKKSTLSEPVKQKIVEMHNKSNIPKKLAASEKDKVIPLSRKDKEKADAKKKQRKQADKNRVDKFYRKKYPENYANIGKPVEDKIEKSDSDLAKGSLQSRNKTRKNKIPEQDLIFTKKWVNATASSADQPSQTQRDERDMINQQPPEFINRLKQRLGSLTNLRRHPETGEIHALLHRGMDDREFDKYHNNGIINHDVSSSWTTDKNQASYFGDSRAGQDKRLVSAWVPISSIKSAPFLIPKGPHKSMDIFQQASRSENELIVGPDHNSLVTSEEYKPNKDTIGQKVKDFKGGRWNRNMIRNQIQKEQEDKLAASESVFIDLNKGSLQRKMPFNPRKDISTESRIASEGWQEGITDTKNKKLFPREKIPALEGNARARALNKLHSKTEVRKHPKTGERMFLMHRGHHVDEELGSEKSSWTPDKKQAEMFANYLNDDYNGTGMVSSAWIPESAIHHIPMQIGNTKEMLKVPKLHSPSGKKQNYFSGTGEKELKEKIKNAKEGIPQANVSEPRFKEEHEVIVNPHDFIRAKRPRLKSQEKLDRRINERQNIYNTYKDFRNVDESEKISEFNRKNIPQKLAASENVESDLNKMSQPFPTFPKIKSVTTRPDTEMRPTEEKDYTLPARTDKESKYDGTYGIPRKFTQGDIAEKKFASKLPKSKASRLNDQIRTPVNQVAKIGGTNGGNLGGLVISDSQEKDAVMGFYNPKKGKSAKGHEAFHYVIAKIAQKYNLDPIEKARISAHLLTHIHPDDYKAMRSMVAFRGYNVNNPSLDEETIAHIHDYMNDSETRDFLHKHLANNPNLKDLPQDKLDRHNLVRNPHEILVPNRLKAGYKSLINASKNLDEEKISAITGKKIQNNNNSGNIQIAASKNNENTEVK